MRDLARCNLHKMKNRKNNITDIFVQYLESKPIPMAAQSKASVCGRSLAGIVGSNPTGSMDVCLV
jgi:hypothetical protein